MTWGRLLALLTLVTFTSVALARPVRVGSFAEIPYGVSARHPYASARGNAGRTGRTYVLAPREAPTKRFEVALRGALLAAPAVHENGTLFVGSGTGLTGVSPTGEVLFGLRLGAVTSTPSITPEGHVLLQAAHTPVALRVEPTGVVRDEIRLRIATQGSPLVLPDGSFVLAAFDQSLQRVDAAGSAVFRAGLPAPATSDIALTSGGALAVAAGSELLFFSVRGQLLGRASLGARIVAGPAAGIGNVVWVATEDGAVATMEPDGTVRMRVETDLDFTAASMAIGADGSARIAPREAELVCVAPSGTIRYRVSGQGVFPGGITLDREDSALVVNDRGRLLLIEADGAVRWTVDLGFRADPAPVLGPDGTIYVLSVTGSVVAYR